MTIGHWHDDPKAARGAERLYDLVGKNVIAFQVTGRVANGVGNCDW